jgi:hypothetical protein
MISRIAIAFIVTLLFVQANAQKVYSSISKGNRAYAKENYVDAEVFIKKH